MGKDGVDSVKPKKHLIEQSFNGRVLAPEVGLCYKSSVTRPEWAYSTSSCHCSEPTLSNSSLTSLVPPSSIETGIEIHDQPIAKQLIMLTKKEVVRSYPPARVTKVITTCSCLIGISHCLRPYHFKCLIGLRLFSLFSAFLSANIVLEIH